MAVGLRRIGPAFIVGACIIGPGSVTLMSRTGAVYGYSMLWLAILAGALMAGFLALFLRFGLYSRETFLGLASRKVGPWFAVVCGFSLASVNATFQFGNNLGVTAAMTTLFGDIPKIVWPLGFTLLSIVFLAGFRNIYLLLERLMTFFLVFMVLAFVANLLWAGPDWLAALKGAVVPNIPEGADWLTLGGLVATTFVMVAAFFQSYLVRAKGWKEEDLSSGVTDTVLASVLYTAIGCVIMMTAAAVLYPGGRVDSAAGMAMQLEGVFGPYARIIFCIGFGTAAFSSFVTNAMIGGVLINDGLGLGGRVNSKSTKLIAGIILLIGMATAIAILQSEAPADAVGSSAAAKSQLEIRALALAQALTLLAMPLGVLATLLAFFDRDAMAAPASLVATGTGIRCRGSDRAPGNRRHDGAPGGTDGSGPGGRVGNKQWRRTFGSWRFNLTSRGRIPGRP